MIEHHIQNDLDPRFLEEPDHLFELSTLFVILDRCRICCVGSKESYRIVPPVLQQSLSVITPGIDIFVKFKDRHQFHSRYAKLFEVRNLLDDTCKSAGILHVGSLVPRKSADMHLINDSIFHRRMREVVLRPAEILFHYP